MKNIADVPHILRLIILFGLLLTSSRANARIVILPEKITLQGTEARQVLIVQHLENKQFIQQLTNDITFVSSNPQVVKIEDGVALPIANGSATISVKIGRQTAKAQVLVSKMDDEFEWSFRNHIQPVLVKTGCSTGPCHGAQAGQAGFTLSLRGYDDDGDYIALTRHALGRRINPDEPGKSMLLTKPTTAVSHKGGKRFEVDSIDYKVLADWIASGAPGPKEKEPRIERIEVLPEHVVLTPGDNQQLIVRAHFSDGHTEDVTHWARYTAANGTVTQVDEGGLVNVIGAGEGVISAWYLQKIALATFTVPYTNTVSKSAFTKAAKRNFIDDLVTEKLKDLNLPPSPRCTDSEFLRRAYLDTIGVLPTVEETKAFLADKSSKKRDALIEQLLQRPEFVDYWSYKWSDLLLVSSGPKTLRQPAMWAYYNWIRQNVANNTPWDKMVTQLITAQGSTLENGAANFYILHDEPRILAENVSQAFLGMSINCAKCHNHPMEKWTNGEYYQFANLFSRVRVKNGASDGDKIIFAATEGDLVQPRTGKPQVPRPLDGKPVPIDSPEDRRQAVADWLTAPENPYFTRAIVNRVWANFYGIGLVDAVDDLRITNPASNEKLFAATTRFLVEKQYDLKALMRVILQSEAYQRSSEALPGNVADTRYYSRYYPRRLMAEVLLDSLSQVTEVATQFRGESTRGGATPINYPENLRALQLPDASVDSYFLKTFGRPVREKTCECERTSEPNVTQVLHIANGDTLNEKLTAKDGRISRWLEKKTTWDETIDEVYLASLNRTPTTQEKQKLLKILSTTPETEIRPALEDMLWAVLSSKEFLFNH